MNHLSLLLALMALSCGAPSKDELLSRYLKERIGLDANHFPKAIVVVSEDDCVHCDRTFADLVRPRTSMANCLFIVRLEGNSVDMHGFMNETDNIHFDYDRSFKRLGILDGSGVIEMNGSMIDTIIPIQLNQIEERLHHIKNVLDSIAGLPQ